MQIVIRKGDHSDIPKVLEELKAFSEFYDSKYNLYKDDETSSEIIKGIMDNHLFLVALSPEDELVGFISGLIHPHLFNPDIKTLSEAFWWVKPEYRNSKAGSMLLKEYIEFGKLNADWIICTIERHSPVNDETFLKRGFRLQEKSFLMEVH